MKKLFFLSCFLINFVFSQETELRKILFLQDQRSLGKNDLVNYLSDKDESVAIAAAFALANIQDSNQVEPLISALKDNRIKVSMASAFALGQIGRNSRSEKALLQKLQPNPGSELKIKIFEALGKIGNLESLNEILKFNDQSDTLIYEKILSISRFALRKVKSKDATEFVIKYSQNKNANIRSICAFTLWRIGDKNLLKPFSENLVKLQNDKDTYTKMWTANAIGMLDSNDIFKKSLLNSLNGTDWKVQVNVLKVLEKYKLGKEEMSIVSKKITDENEHISLATIRYLKKAKYESGFSVSDILNKLLFVINDPKFTWLQKGEAAISLSEVILNPDDGIMFISPLLNTNNFRLKAKVVTAFSNLHSFKVLNILIDSIKNTEPLISMSRIEALARVCEKIEPTDPQKGQISILFQKFLDEKDMAVTTTLATALRDSCFKGIIPSKELINTFNRMKVPDDIEAMVEIINTLAEYKSDEVVPFLEQILNTSEKNIVIAAVNSLKKLTKKDYSSKIPTNSNISYADYDWGYLSNLENSSYFTIKTSKGNIKIKMFLKEAPFTSMSFSKLIDKKFFDGLVFHRVVPNFVIQGGDPRGDGWGGPGFSIRTEISNKIFKKGMVGIASAGKDTEGCQFFITHSPTPHLDGKYTIFGEVIQGMEVVDKIQEGDKIISIVK